MVRALNLLPFLQPLASPVDRYQLHVTGGELLKRMLKKQFSTRRLMIGQRVVAATQEKR